MADPREMQSAPGAEPVLEDPALPTMAPFPGGAAAPTASGGEEMAPFVPPEEGEEMAPFVPPEEGERGYPDMIPLEGRGGSDAASFAAGPQEEGYLRLVVSVEDGAMSVVDASVVAGRLVEDADLTGEMVYEARVDGRRVGSEAFADLAEIHSLPPPDDPERGHHFGRARRFDFVVRIPRAEVTLEELERLEIDLFRPETTTDLSLGIEPSPGMTFEQAATARGLPAPPVVASLKGVDLEELPSRAAEAVRDALR